MEAFLKLSEEKINSLSEAEFQVSFQVGKTNRRVLK